MFARVASYSHPVSQYSKAGKNFPWSSNGKKVCVAPRKTPLAHENSRGHVPGALVPPSSWTPHCASLSPLNFTLVPDRTINKPICQMKELSPGGKKFGFPAYVDMSTALRPTI